MATANDLIKRALRKGRCIGKDQTPTADESADALSELNSMLGKWRNEGLLIPRIQQESFALVSGQASRTIGPTGNFATVRPTGIAAGCFVRRGGVDTPVAVLPDRTQYDAIAVKSTAGLVKAIYYDPTYPNGTLYFYPVPDAADTIFLNSLAQLQADLTLVTTLTLPPGYDTLVTYGLVKRLCPEYGLDTPADVKLEFASTLRSIKKTNTRAVVMRTDAALLPAVGYTDIRTLDR